MALTAGLDTVIIDPGAPGVRDTLMAFNLLANYDADAKAFIRDYGLEAPPSPTTESPKEETCPDLLLKGDQAGTKALTQALLKNHEPLWIVENHLVPALDEVGRQYEDKRIYLPQLIRAAETAGVAFDLVRKKLLSSGENLASKGTIILATVQGDVHDLGKNLVKVLLENYGYHIIDLGRDVLADRILEAVEQHDVKLVGLSALMTTTVLHMEGTIKAIKRKHPDVAVFVGGAVLTPEYAREIGADHYGRDARSAVTIADQFFKK
jgi:5-methyltetrahydrofolate--homocysteine methyltransferase